MQRLKEKCFHCDPYPDDSAHVFEKIEQFFSPLFSVFLPVEKVLKKVPQLHLAVSRAIFEGFANVFFALKILKEVEVQDDDEEIYNRSLVLVREARKRGITIKVITFFGRKTNQFSIEVKGVKRFFEGLPDSTAESSAFVDFGDKGVLKKILEKEQLPHPEGCAFSKVAKATRYVHDVLHYPVVVKPRSGSLSRHTTCNIQNEQELQTAIGIAKILSKDFVAEKYIEGDAYRVTMVNGQIVAACLREPPNVVGDGEHTLEGLVKKKNEHPDRGDFWQKNFTLHKLIVTNRSQTILDSQQVQLDSVVDAGKKIYLHDKVVLAAGADIHDVTDLIHPDNRELFRKVHEICDAPIIGIDFIAKDISVSYREQRCAVIEVNSLPYIDMHHYPVTGSVRNVAGSILDYYLSLFE